MSKVWFITGAGSGIGAGTAIAALKAGDRVVATGRHLDKLRKALDCFGGNNLALMQLDISQARQAQAAVNEAVKRFGRIDVLVNNAGYSLLGNFEELAVEDIERQFATNFYGVVYLMRAVLPVMRQQRAGRIINVSSLAGLLGFKHCAAYGASKFAVEGLSLAVAAEVEQFGIKVTVVEPGFFRTDLLDANNVRWSHQPIGDYAAEGSTPDLWAGYHGTQPGDPAALGAVMVKLAEMQDPPKQLLAGSDAVALIAPALSARLQEIERYQALSKSTDGAF
jgi:NAD(P)-dependent dehydrogenase (short-subunit alcohol dehydrogenase family)